MYVLSSAGVGLGVTVRGKVNVSILCSTRIATNKTKAYEEDSEFGGTPKAPQSRSRRPIGMSSSGGGTEETKQFQAGSSTAKSR